MSYSLSLCTLLILFSLVYCPAIPFVSSLSFNISSFDKNLNDIIYEGFASLATTTYGSVDLTKGNNQPCFQVGRIQYSKPIDLWDFVTGRQADFSNRFSFTIDTYNSPRYSDGIAFFLAPVGFPIPPNSGGEFLGLFNESTAVDGPRNQIVMVEFDTLVNSAFDPPVRHIGINKNSLPSLVHASWDPGSHSGNATNVMVTYNSTSKYLSVLWSLDDEPISPANKHCSLSYEIDLAKVLPESVAIGFSASTSILGERNSINSWEFTSNLDVVHPPSIDTSKKRVKCKMYSLITFITVPVASLFLVISAGSSLFMIKKRRSHEFLALTDIDKEIGAWPLRFSYQELLEATRGFTNDRRLGQGGSGQVYRGLLNCLDRLVAVKRIFAESKHSKKVFINEVKIISHLIHRFFVQFIRWCQEEGEYLLVYEYMPNGSLDDHLYGTRKSLPWDVRYKIALGLALALNYLHEEQEQCVLHRDIKAANILLDTNFNTKLGDFGVAKLVDPLFRTQMTDVVGTCGYLAPEYATRGRATKGSDMFSFGVVALEIACGRRTYREREFHVPLYKWVWQLYLIGNMLEAADETLNSSFDRKEMECLMMLGLWCVHPDPKKRPHAGQVIRFLQLEAPVPEFPCDAYEVPFLYQRSAFRVESSSSIQESPPVKQNISLLQKPSSKKCCDGLLCSINLFFAVIYRLAADQWVHVDFTETAVPFHMASYANARVL